MATCPLRCPRNPLKQEHPQSSPRGSSPWAVPEPQAQAGTQKVSPSWTKEKPGQKRI